MTEPQSGAELLARIKPRLREDRTQLCLRPDLLDAWADAAETLAEKQAESQQSERLGTKGNTATVKKLAAEVQRIENEISETGIWFHFRAMPKDAWQALCAAHAPRANNQIDAFAGYDRDAVLDAMVRECLVDPVFDDASWAEFLAVCNPSEWNELRETVNRVNQSVVDAPKSELASRILRKHASASAPLAPGA